MQDSTKKRGRPRAFDPDTALKAAAERFRAGGYSGTSLDELAAATRLNRPSLYSAFGDKKALYLAALERTHARAERGFVRLGGGGSAGARDARNPARRGDRRLPHGG
jgi:AcrR family transcriptional regulator